MDQRSQPDAPHYHRSDRVGTRARQTLAYQESDMSSNSQTSLPPPGGQFFDRPRPPPGFSQRPSSNHWDDQVSQQQQNPHEPVFGGPVREMAQPNQGFDARREMAPPAALDFESQMRNMILKNSNAQTQPPETSNTTQPAGPQSNKPHAATTTRRRLTQAERRQGQSNRLDLSQPPATQAQDGGRQGYQNSNWRQGYGGGRQMDSQRGRPSHKQYPSTGPPQGDYQAQNVSPTYPRNNGWGPPSPRQHIHMHGTRSIDYTVNNGHPDAPQLSPTSAFSPASPTSMGPEFATRPRGPGGRQLYDPNAGRMSTLPPRRQAEYLDGLVAQHVPHMGVTVDEERNYAWLGRHLSVIVQTALHTSEEARNIPNESIRLECFGSLASGFGMTNSDMDLMVFYDTENLSESQHTAIPRIIEKALLDAGHGARLLTRTRVPIIRFCSSPSNELLEALRLERAKWEEEKDKLPLEGEEVEEAQVEDDEEDREGEGDENEGEEDSGGSDAEDTSSEHSEGAVSPESPRDTNKTNTEKADESVAASINSTSAQPGHTVSAEVVEEDSVNKHGQAPKKDKKSGRKAKRGHKKGKKKEDGKESKEQKEPGPPPYKNDQERIEMYRLAIKEDWFSSEERQLIFRFAKEFESAQGNADDQNVIECRKALDALPDVLSRYREPRKRGQELEFPEGSGLLCDLNFSTGAHSNPLAVHNTRLQRCYSLFDPRIKQMVVFVKGWAKRRNINKPYHGTLSSYGYVLMVLHYVVNIVQPPLAPNIQLLHERNSHTGYQAPENCDKFDVRFWQDQDAIRMAAHTEFGQNMQSVGSLLAGFFRYYAVHEYRGVKGFEWMKDVLSLRSPGGLMSKQDKGWTGKWTQSTEADDEVIKAREITHRYLVAIEDPFEHEHNVGRPVMHHGIVAIREEFRRANQIIISGGFWNNKQVSFFEPGQEHQREHRYFGPNPKYKKEKPPLIGPKNLTGEARRKANEKAAKESEEGLKADAEKIAPSNTKDSNNTSTDATKDVKEASETQDGKELLSSESKEEASGSKRPRKRYPRKPKANKEGGEAGSAQ